MGNGSSSKFFGKKEFKGDMIVLCGMYGTGRKTFEDKFNEKVKLSTSSAGMMNFASLKSITFLTPDISGRCPLRPRLHYFYKKMAAMIFMMDSAETGVSLYVVDQFQRTANDEELMDLPVLVLANKQDLPGAMSIQQIEKKLGMTELKQQNNKRAIEILPVSVLKEEGMQEAMEWIQHQLQLKHAREALVKPVEKAVPSCLSSFYNSVSSALKQTFGSIRKSWAHLTLSH